MSKPRCPICRREATKALMGIFPVNLCLDSRCATCWGAWLGIASALVDFITPYDGGWWFFPYEGSYLKALVTRWRSEGHPS